MSCPGGQTKEANMNEIITGVAAFVMLMTVLVWLGLTV
jgi:hypothetical protein